MLCCAKELSNDMRHAFLVEPFLRYIHKNEGKMTIFGHFHGERGVGPKTTFGENTSSKFL